MEHHTPSSTGSARLLGIPTVIWVTLAGLAAAIVAIFVFKLAIGTVVTYGFISLMVLSHLFMHGRHGSHGAHGSQPSSQVIDETDNDRKAAHIGHGGCH